MIAIASDDQGFLYKREMKRYLRPTGFDVSDMGCVEKTSKPFEEDVLKVAEALNSGAANRGILISETGIGMSIIANKLPGIRAALCFDERAAKQAVQDYDANVLVLAAGQTDKKRAVEIMLTFLSTENNADSPSVMIESLDDIATSQLLTGEKTC